MSTAVLLLPVLALGGCGSETTPATPVRVGDQLLAGIKYSADLDNDGVSEEFRVDSASAALVITDGKVVYRSREKWRIFQAALGDTDGDSLLEVVALLDAADGRHLGLFAYFGGRYRERLVTRPLRPEPVALTVLPRDQDATAQVEGRDLVLLEERTNEDGADGSTNVFTLYRWNGFGFTAMGKF